MQTKLNGLLTEAGLTIPVSQQQQLVRLVELLAKWNKAYNLTSVRDPEQMLSRHIVDSLVVLPFLSGHRFIDVGTGPGLPGLPLAIVQPEKEFVLLDSLGKRIRFIRQVCHELGINNVNAVQSRVENYDPETKFDGVISRAFASLNDMLNWCRHLPTADGQFYALKGVYPQAELDTLPAHYNVEKVVELKVPGVDAERHLVIISTRG
ncbi:16S rRNA (guanine(527)-N(7))-methyltransferase RsmG [Pseudidiomarina terrestris]|uniref:Ribosomal RNA small subunit methyltransferase G n=1 Tax=Pseudidiomarina terrestris TaxID=2820060 RepID=A0AAW7QYY4_9GAMM|nr:MULTISPECIES: 16S rRNA (guanine(527)-N(7))-methyltransferase RsmG [unclassified Pseudidiomarina]MDN7125362.1 16S rRNA (guanine(527)-N(7))-methyltransferase RsmG [Pseudidiomarina sp. 1APP75-32.1]MDN7130120.1 16S rRNA (guanine(527)-N(7))-methyltransferase RsmG [Pseudidiomarina sp. 1APR75-15]MDN7135625.1 16S rRNA (guanine(527)-N(7))-methyltransferase RsmG [Pseudidiomarina sp. 1ASP75-5]MDN7137337.1 16S rRNA (guanine(527)-N(7))-methyltransferase RsmG [Pseudidiomarina sp. 1ASP75-14]MEA3588630.1 1